jgi:hypothetical protein
VLRLILDDDSVALFAESELVLVVDKDSWIGDYYATAYKSAAYLLAEDWVEIEGCPMQIKSISRVPEVPSFCVSPKGAEP